MSKTAQESFTVSQALAKAIAFGGYFNGKIFDGEINPDTIHFDSLFSYYGFVNYQRTVLDTNSLLIGFVTYDDGRDMPDQFFGEENEAQEYIERKGKKMSIGEVFLLRETFENERKSVPSLVEVFEKYGTVLHFEDKVFDLKTVAGVTNYANKFFSLNVKIAEIVLSALASENGRAIDEDKEFDVQKAIENLNWPKYDFRDDSTRSNDSVKDHHLYKSLIACVSDGSSQTTDAQHIATHFGLERIIDNVDTMTIGALRKAMFEKPTLVLVNDDRNSAGFLGLNGLLAAVASLDFVTQKMAQNCANDALAAVDAMLKLEKS